MTENLTLAVIVLHPFRTYRKGDIVRDAAAIVDIKTSVSPSNFVVASIPAAATPSGKTS